MPYPYAEHMAEIATWYRSVVQSQPAGPIRTAHGLLLTEYDSMVKIASQPDVPREAVAALVQWCRVVIVLAEAAREAGHPGWTDAWTDVYDYYLPGQDRVLGPYGPDGP